MTMHGQGSAQSSSDTMLPLRARVLRTVLLWFGAGGALAGSLLLFVSHTHAPELQTLRIGGYMVLSLPLLTLLQRIIGYRATIHVLLWHLLIVCTYFQCFHGLTPATTIGTVSTLVLAGVFFDARGVLWASGAALLGAALAAVLLFGQVVEPWEPWFWDPHDPLVWLRYALVLVCFGGGLASALVLMIRGLEDTEASLQRTLASERIERAQRERAQRALDQAQRIEALGQFAAGMAHDFNHTLMVIMGGANVIRSYPRMPPDVLAASDEIIERAEVGAETIRQLLSLGRGDVGKPMRARLADVLTRSLPTLRQAVGQAVQVQLDCTCDLQVYVDVARLQQALLNLALNARDAMPSGGRLTLRVFERQFDEVPVGWNAMPGSFVCIECADTGIGLDEALMNKIFEPFFTTKEGHGTGLGLPMVRKTVLDARGFIQATSQPGQGTAFSLFLPLGQQT